MATNVIMPSLGFDMTEGKLANWLKKEGDKVEKGQAIAEIETEKATVEIEATVAGTIRSIIVPAGQTVPVGTVIAVIGDPADKGMAPHEPTTSAPEPAAREVPPSEKPAPATPAPEPTPSGQGQVAEPETRVRASPLARRMAQEAGLDLSRITGTGPGGRIMERDIQGAMAGRSTVAPAPSRPQAPPAPKSTFPAQPPIAPPAPATPPAPLNKMRQAIARRMTESKTTVPHFYITVAVNMTEALDVREQLNAMASDADKVSVNDLVVAAVARTLTQFRYLNASYRDGSLERHSDINIGLAVALEDGLITPVIHNADQKSIRAIAVESKAVTERARSNRLRADDLTGGTFTVSNLGMFGVDEFIAIINPPEAAILAVGAATKQPIVRDDQVSIAPLMKATISVDHRVADGAQAARFMAEFKKLLENPVNLLVGG